MSSRSPSRLLLGVAAALALALSPPAAAQPRDPAGAEKLYDDGAKLQKAGDWAGACSRFEQSFALDPAPGTLLNLASCAEHDGKIALAWSRLKDARSLNADTQSDKRREEIERFIAASIARLEPRIPYLTVRVAGGPAGLRVSRDGQPTSVGVELPIDPGKHVIVAEAPGYVEARREITIAEGAHDAIDLELTPAPAGAPVPAPVAAPVSPPGPAAAPASPPTSDGEGMSGMRIAGLIMGGAGVLTLGVSAVTGMIALGKESDLGDRGCRAQGDALGCPEDVRTEAENLSSSGSTMAGVSTATTFVGGALVGTGFLLYVLGGSSGSGSKEARGARYGASVGPGGARVHLQGSF